MPLRNRVTPFGAIISTPAHGTLMGNRGILHNDQKEITRTHNGKRWVTCTLVGKPNGPKRPLMEPRHYTVLFFLDEATALAAGHRPCATCRRKEYDEFLRIWSVANGTAPEGTAAIKRLDEILQRERVQRGGPKPSHEENFDTLPDGSMVDIGGSAYLVKGGDLLQWSPAGYIAKVERPAQTTATVLTPKSIVNCLRAGYVPDIHASASAFRVPVA